MTERAIQLKRLETRNTNHWHLRGFRLRVEVAAVQGDMPEHVFVFRRHPANPETGEVVDEFVSVASFPDIAEYPVNAPNVDQRLPFFRRNAIELDTRSTAQAQEIWLLLQAEVCHLLQALNFADSLVVVDTVWCGTPSDAASASSESASAVSLPSEGSSASESASESPGP